MSTQTALPKPDFGRLYGVTYDQTSKSAIVRTPRVLKVGIGIPKGRAIHVFMHSGDWIIRFGAWEEKDGKKKLVMKTVYRGNQNGLSNKQADVEAWYNAHKQDAAVSNRPQKIPHFTFTQRTIIEDGGGKPVEVFEPDFDAIFAHGNSPRKIPVILTKDAPIWQEDQFWTATELKCHGDGLLAERILSMGSAKDQYWQIAKDAGLKMFPYGPCRLGGCPHAGVDCKKHSTIDLQLAYALRLGATAYFSSTGDVTASRLFSSFEDIAGPLAKMGYSVVGVPMYLVLGSFRANHEGKASAQPCVSLELTAAGSKALNQLLAENAWAPAKIGTGPRQIAAPEEPMLDATAEVLAPGIMNEFSEPEFDDDAVTVEASPAATATQAKTEALSEKIRKTKEGVAPVTAAAPDPGPAVNVPAQSATSAPWTDRPSMNSALTAQKTRIGQEAFDGLLAKHNVLMGSLKFDDPKAAVLYAEMVAAPMASLPEDVF